MIITPWKSLAGATGYTPTAANFPMLKHYWPCDYSSADLQAGLLTDTIGGVLFTCDTVISAHATVSGVLNISSGNTTYTSGTIASPGTKSIAVIVLGVPLSTSNGLILGSVTAANNQGMRVSAVTTNRTAAAINAASTGVCTDGPTGANAALAYAAQVAIVPSSTSTLHSVSYDGTTFSEYTDKTMATTPAGGMTAIEQSGTMSSNMFPGAILILHPTTAFSNAELKSVVAWAYWAVFTEKNKSKIIAPWLRGRV